MIAGSRCPAKKTAGATALACCLAALLVPRTLEKYQFFPFAPARPQVIHPMSYTNFNMNAKQINPSSVVIAETESSNSEVQYFVGLDGVKQAFLETLDLPEGEMIYAFLHPDSVTDELYEWLTTTYVTKRVEKHLFAHVFVTDHGGSQRVVKYKELDDSEKRQTHIVDAFDFHFESEVNIFGKKIAFFVTHDPEKYRAIIITNPTIVSTIKSFYLHYLWKI